MNWDPARKSVVGSAKHSMLISMLISMVDWNSKGRLFLDVLIREMAMEILPVALPKLESILIILKY